MRILARSLPLAAATLVATLALGGPSSAQIPTTGSVVSLTFGAKPSLDISTPTQGLSSVGSEVSSGTSAPVIPPAQVSIDLAPGYTVSPVAPGEEVGLAFVSSSSGTPTSGSIAILIGAITADDPAKYAGDPAARACAPGPYTAVWRFATTIFGLGFTLPIFVEHPAGNPQAVELRFCPPPLSGSDGMPVTASPVPLDGASLFLGALLPPSATGDYTSHMLVTPQAPTGAPDPSATVEARFVDPVPHTLTARARYDKKSHDALLTGRVTERGKPQARALVQYLRSDVQTLPKGVRTSAAGTFTIRTRVAATTSFALFVPDATGVCSGASSAPRGCATQTVAGTNSRIVRVVVPKR